ncbi:Dam family site-specific DNA-(adenine-N6)-methyltransferase [Candidatus Saccharibacteria bacterium]|nr:Dam family site-specific DNA-(adenine-N6)-methyltransferase [Candidatus Saccharibacteria bacterium]
MDFIKSPLNYTGGKFAILPQLFPLFPKTINTFLDMFAGGANVGINANANEIVLNDNLVFLMDIYSDLQSKEADGIFEEIEEIIKKYKLSLTNRDGYNKLRNDYNKDKTPILLLVLSFYSFNHQIRFNNQHEFNTPFGLNRSRYNKRIKDNLKGFMGALKNKNIIISKKEFNKYDVSVLGEGDFVYCDPPYLITTGTYNDGKRGFTGWGEKQERNLLQLLNELNSNGVKFALSNVTHHKGMINDILLEWIDSKNHIVHEIKKDYTNSSYHAKYRNGNETKEVLITNY